MSSGIIGDVALNGRLQIALYWIRVTVGASSTKSRSRIKLICCIPFSAVVPPLRKVKYLSYQPKAAQSHYLLLFLVPAVTGTDTFSYNSREAPSAFSGTVQHSTPSNIYLFLIWKWNSLASKLTFYSLVFTTQKTMPSENHSESLPHDPRKHVEDGKQPASPQSHGRGRDGVDKVAHICPGWLALEWTHTVQGPKNRRTTFDRLTAAMKAKKQRVKGHHNAYPCLMRVSRGQNKAKYKCQSHSAWVLGMY